MRKNANHEDRLIHLAEFPEHLGIDHDSPPWAVAQTLGKVPSLRKFLKPRPGEIFLPSIIHRAGSSSREEHRYDSWRMGSQTNASPQAMAAEGDV